MEEEALRAEKSGAQVGKSFMGIIRITVEITSLNGYWWVINEELFLK